MPDLGGSGEDESREDRLWVELSPEVRSLRLEPGPGRFLRVRSVSVHVAQARGVSA